jgi:hypothetical protein
MSDTKLRYEFLERRVRGQACVDIFMLPLPVPRYSFKVSSARVTQDADGEKRVTVIPFLSAFSYVDAAQLLLEVGHEFEGRRDTAKVEATTAIGAQIKNAKGPNRK